MNCSMQKDAVDKSFSRAAGTYDVWAKPQKIIALNLIRFLREGTPGHFSPARILDIGCGTGILISSLRENYPDAEILGLDIARGMINRCKQAFKEDKKIRFCQVDAETYPLDAFYQLMISSSSLQWFQNPAFYISSVLSFIETGGYFAASVLVKGSFFELSESFLSSINRPFSPLALFNKNYYLSLLLKYKNRSVSYKTGRITVFYSEPQDALRSFNRTGATFRYRRDYLPLSYSEVKKSLKFYTEQYKNDKAGYPVTYQVLYFVVGA
jgi:malonyl-CoA O-methyltransferase